MLYIFRKLRAKIFLDHKITGYLFYALGEIVLVVLGILIALQINTWVNWKKDRTKENEYIDALIAEISRDTVVFKEAMQELQSQGAAVRSVLNIIENPDYIIHDSLQIINDFYAGGNSLTLSLENVIWTDLQSTGNLNLFQDKQLLKALGKYYSDVNRQIKDFSDFAEKQRLEARGLIHDFFNVEELDDYFADWNQDEAPRKEVFETIRKPGELTGLLKSIMLSSDVQQRQFQALWNSADSALVLLHGHFNK